MPISTWRLIENDALQGPMNMAIDEALLESVSAGRSLPVLRLFRWSPPCLSIGYAQKCSEVDTHALTDLGWDLVRRPTGGRAILHTDELTYSVIAPPDEPHVTGTLLESYRRLSQALLHALQLLEVPARADDIYSQAAMLPANGPVCFERPSNYEITCDGKKLIGSAQARRNDGVLQHGSLPLSGDITRITRVLAFPDAEARSTAAERLLAHATTVETALGYPVSWEKAADAFRQGFARTLDIEFQSEALRIEEMQRASELFTDKYSNSTWNSRL